MKNDIPILKVGGMLLVSVQTDLGDEVAEEFQSDLLAAIERVGAPGLVIDITGLDVVDTYVARVLADTATMAKLMGTETVLVGMRPEIAATLVQMSYPIEGVHTALDIDDGLAKLRDLVADPTRR